MIIKLPFYKNPHKQCTQVSMKVVLEHFLNKKYSLEHLDKLTERNDSQPTATSQAAAVLYNLGLKIRYYSNGPIEPFSEINKMKSYLGGRYGDEYLKFYLENANIPAIIKSSSILIKHGLFEFRKLTFNEIEQHLEMGHIPIMSIDPIVIMFGKKERSFENHSVVVTGFEDDKVFFHESGPHNYSPNKIVSKQTFIAAWDTEITDSDVIIVYGRREK